MSVTREPFKLSLIDDLRRCDYAALCSDYRVVLGLAVASEVEECAFVALTPIEVAGRGDHLIGRCQRLRDDLTRRRNDHGLRERVDAFFDTTLGHADDPGAVLDRADLHYEDRK